jgi:hypothetical protein
MENNNSINFEENKPYFAPHYPFSLEGHWQPWYDDRRDYNTNAPSYYDYLSNFNKLIKSIVELLNRVARRNVQVEDTNCIDLTKINDWIDEGNACHTWHDEIILKAEVILSTIQKAVEFDGQSYNIENAIECLPTGLFAPNYLPFLEKLLAKINQEILDRIAADEELDRKITAERNARIEADNALGVRIDNETSARQNADTALGVRINNETSSRQNADTALGTRIDNETSARQNADTALSNRITVLENALTKVLTDLKGSGAWTSGNNVLTGSMTANRHIASGNINLFTGTTDGNTFIRTTSGQNENDATIGARG